jgi:hypothetical protein
MLDGISGNRLKVEDKLITPAELANRLQVPMGWIYRHASELGAYHLGKYLRFSWSRVLEHINSSARKPVRSEGD